MFIFLFFLLMASFLYWDYSKEREKQKRKDREIREQADAIREEELREEIARRMAQKDKEDRARWNRQQKTQQSNNSYTNRQQGSQSNIRPDISDIFTDIQEDYHLYKHRGNCKITRESKNGTNSILYKFGNTKRYDYVKVSAANGQSYGTMEYTWYSSTKINYENQALKAAEFNQFFKLVNDLYKESKSGRTYNDPVDDFFSGNASFDDFFKNQFRDGFTQGQYDGNQQRQQQPPKPQGKIHNDKNTSHKKYPLYSKLRDTVNARKENLKGLKPTDSDYKSLKHELSTAESQLSKMKIKYKF